MRDWVKGGRDAIDQLRTRLFCIKRGSRSWIHTTARLDVVPRASSHSWHPLELADRAYVEARCTINTWCGQVVIGAGSGIGIGSIVIGPVTIGEECAVSQHCFVSGLDHKYEDFNRSVLEQGDVIAEVRIGSHVWVGANTVVLPGVSIGCHSVIGAGSVVTRDIPSCSLAVGNPARVVKYYDPSERKWVRC